MGAIRNIVIEIEGKMNPGGGSIVLYLDKDGWYEWTSANFWDSAKHAHFRQPRQEVGRFDELIEALAARDSFNQIVHGQPKKSMLFEYQEK